MTYAKIADVKVGTKLKADGGFITDSLPDGNGEYDRCIGEGAVLVVRSDAHGLYVECAEGHHYLDGQIDGDHYVGFELA